MNKNVKKSFLIFKEKLNPFLIGLSEIVNYDLSMSDMDAIEYGIFNTSDERNLWWDYSLLGKSTADLEFALDEENRDILFIRLTIEEQLIKELGLLIFMIETFELKEIYPLH